MSLTHIPEPWRPNTIYGLGDRMTIRDERAVFVLRCEKAGESGPRPPRILASSAIAGMTQGLRTTTIVTVWDAECDWRVERVIRKGYAPGE